MAKPFIEHPTGQFNSVTLAMEAAVERLRNLPQWENWITLTGQGAGSHPDSSAFAEVRLLADKIDIGKGSLDLPSIISAAQVASSCIVAKDKYYSLAGASPAEVARILDAIFRHHFHIHPFPDGDNDYAFGAEW